VCGLLFGAVATEDQVRHRVRAAFTDQPVVARCLCGGDGVDAGHHRLGIQGGVF